ncbi:PREDICTED: rab proteins geranylgeranyltransferase component A 2-like [Priapulus caudatus]|uniref:Rab proteins geranylgeranyltransferase component A 2-like n=1 Tax=Priapulus caudatus TaxID=37621 RepID=A0ABM1EU72_PRICU|nr:PREDICTED: rab proteins geranylgeranyltransferase component A 2-like [Priapulus caudatus]
MADNLPTEFDAIVVGTGMTECILAAALARIGKNVLHIDRNDHYGGDWASFNMDSMRRWIANHRGEECPPSVMEIPEYSSLLHYLSINPKTENEEAAEEKEKPSPASLLLEGELLVEARMESSTITNVVEKIFVREKSEVEVSKEPSESEQQGTADTQQSTETEQKGVTNAQQTTASASKTHTNEDEQEPSVESVIAEALACTEEEMKEEKEEEDENKSESAMDEAIMCTPSYDTVPTGADAQDTHIMNSTSETLEPQPTADADARVGTEEKPATEPSSQSPLCDAQSVDDDSESTAPVADADAGAITDADTKSAAGSITDTAEAAAAVANAAASSPAQADAAAAAAEWTMERIMKRWRRFNLDLEPKLLFSRGSLVELLVSSNIARYAEFKILTQVLTLLDGRLERVPCSRADVFSSKKVSVIEKRMLMKFIQFCLGYENTPAEYAGFEDRPFSEFLMSRKLTPNLRHFVLHSIAMVTEDCPTERALGETRRFLQSLGRFGNSPFLWPMYGSGELPQCFCRLCAVFGGIYCLRRMPQCVVIDAASNRCKAIVCNENQRISCDWLIMEASYAPEQYVPRPETRRSISRAILITDGALLKEKQEQLTLMSLPVGMPGRSPVRLLELGPSTMACPRDLRIVHLTCVGGGDAQLDLAPTIDRLFAVAEPPSEAERAAPPGESGERETIGGAAATEAERAGPPGGSDEQETTGGVAAMEAELLAPPGGSGEREAASGAVAAEDRGETDDGKPKLLWSLFFNCQDTTDELAVSEDCPDNVVVCGGPDWTLDFEHSVQEAKDLFRRICPDEEFLPRAPDPDEIVFGDYENPAPTDGFRELATDAESRNNNGGGPTPAADDDRTPAPAAVAPPVDVTHGEMGTHQPDNGGGGFYEQESAVAKDNSSRPSTEEEQD